MPQESTYINRLDTEKDIDFDHIRKEGLRLLQELSGKVWTDYNLHDPGVTILEQLIYALTELSYFTGFEVKNFITAPDGEIKYHDLALYKPLEIFPSENITSNDYCKTIFDSIEGVRNCWTINVDESARKGLHVFLVDFRNNKKNSRTEILQKIKKCYNANRNLCEDLGNIEMLQRQPVEIGATIEINNNRLPEEVLADVFFDCFKIISPQIVFHSFRELSGSDRTLDNILCGPELNHGFIKDEEMPTIKTQIFVSELMKEVFLIDGVESIVDFYVEKEGTKIRTQINLPDPKVSAYIHFPENKNELKIRLLCNGRLCSIQLDEMFRKFYNLYHGYKSTFNTSQDLSELSKLPQGEYVNFGNYYSLQNQFPAIYGINQFGVPFSATPERKAQAKQLKGYLLLFERILANSLTQMENVKELFSLNQAEKISYYTKPLTSVPNVGHVLHSTWKDDADVHQKELQQILSRHDDYYKRKNKFLDFMLSMYGEKLSYHSFKQFNYYYPAEEIPRIICENKIFLLKNLIKINRYRARSFNYQLPSWNTDNVPMIKMKVSLLLGIHDFRQVSYSDVLANYHLRFINKTETGKCDECVFNRQDFNVELDGEYIEEHFTNIPRQQPEEINDYTFLETIREIPYIKEGYICEDFFRYGIYLESYKIGKLKRRKNFTVVFKHPKNNTYIYIGDFDECIQGINAINRLQQLLVKLNIESEGMHLVEHILLRQKNSGYISEYQIVTNDGKIVFSSTPDFVLDENESATQMLSSILTDTDNYSTQTTSDGNHIIVIHRAGKKIFKSLLVFKSEEEALFGIEKFASYFESLANLGMLEQHIKGISRPTVEDDFFNSRLSVILPAWSARFSNLRFRDYVEETFCLNLPAHIYPEFYWLELPALNEFERLYRNWLKVKPSGNTTETDEYAGRIIRFLIKHRPLKYKQND